MDTRTPRAAGGRSPGFDTASVLDTVKVPSDPAQVIVNHASFRVQLPAPAVPGRLLPATGRLLRTSTGGTTTERRSPVVWSGHTSPDDTAAGRLLQAVRDSGAGTTQLLPRARTGGTGPAPAAAPRAPLPASLGVGVGDARPVRGAYDDLDGEPHDGLAEGPYEDPRGGLRGAGGGEAHPRDDVWEDDVWEDGEEDADEPGTRRRGGAPARRAYYPDRRVNLGLVLLPPRLLLGFLAIHAGMDKLSDPRYLDGGERGSLAGWLSSLHPWAVASPLRDAALEHPVGAGLTVAFLQVVVGVLTVLGLWQRAAASAGVLLSAAVLLAAGWRAVPAFDASEALRLAAWGTLVAAGAPVYSADARLAGEAWRSLGPRAPLGALRRRVLRRGVVLTAVVVGLTLLVGSVLGGAVRSSRMTTVPGPSDPPANRLPGSPLPEEPGTVRGESRGPASAGPGAPSAEGSADPPASSSSREPGEARESGSVNPGRPTQGGTGSQVPPEQTGGPAAPSSSGAGATTAGEGASGAGGSGTGASGGGSSSGGGSGNGGGGGSDSSSGGGGREGGALGGLLG